MTIQLTSALLSILMLLNGCASPQPNTPVTNLHQEPLGETKTTDTTEQDPKPQENLFSLCNPHYYGYQGETPEPSKTGIEREEPIVLMTRQAFNDKLQQSPLWDILYDKELRYASYGNIYSLTAMRELLDSNSHIYVNSRLDSMRYSRPEQRFTTLSYKNRLTLTKASYGHQLIPQERYEMIELVSLVIDDREQAIQIVDTLYQQYLKKVANEEYLSDGKTIHTYVEYEGKYFSLWGGQRLDHPIEKCNYRAIGGLMIS